MQADSGDDRRCAKSKNAGPAEALKAVPSAKPPPRRNQACDSAVGMTPFLQTASLEPAKDIRIDILTDEDPKSRSSRDSAAWTSSVVMHILLVTAFWLMLAPKDLGGGDLIEIILELQQVEPEVEQPPEVVLLPTQPLEAAEALDEHVINANETPAEIPEDTGDEIVVDDKSDDAEAVGPRLVARDSRHRDLSVPRAGSDRRTKGPRASFFGTVAEGDRFVYVLDISGSMKTGAARTRLQRASDELISSVNQLQSSQKFHVVLFSNVTRHMFDRKSALAEMIPATLKNKNRLKTWLSGIQPAGNTDPRCAMQTALRLQPSAVFMLSDGQFNGHSRGKTGGPLVGNPTVFKVASDHSGQIPIHTIAYEDVNSCMQMQQLATQSGGEYRFVPAVGADEESLKDALASDNRNERLAALHVLRQRHAVSDQEVGLDLVAKAIDMIADDDEDIREAARTALLPFGGGKDFSPLNDTPTKQELAVARNKWTELFGYFDELRAAELDESLAALRHKDAVKRFVAIKVVGEWRLDFRQKNEIAKQLITMLADDDSDVQWAANGALVDFTGIQNIASLLNVGDRSSIAGSQRNWIDCWRLLYHLESRDFESLADLLAECSDEVRGVGVLQLRDRGRNSNNADYRRIFADFFIEMLASENVQFREWAHQGLVTSSRLTKIPDLLEPPDYAGIVAAQRHWRGALRFLDLIENGSFDAFVKETAQSNVQLRITAATILRERLRELSIADRRMLGDCLIELLGDEAAVRTAAHATLMAMAFNNNLGPHKSSPKERDIAVAKRRWTENWPLAILLENICQSLSASSGGNDEIRLDTINLISGRLTLQRPLSSTHRHSLSQPLIHLLADSHAAVRTTAHDALVLLADDSDLEHTADADASELLASQQKWRAHWERFQAQRVIGPQSRSALRMADALNNRGSKHGVRERYQTILAKFPRTEAARQAKVRLAALVDE